MSVQKNPIGEMIARLGPEGVKQAILEALRRDPALERSFARSLNERVAVVKAKGEAHRPPGDLAEARSEGAHRSDPLARLEWEARTLARFRIMATESGMRPVGCTDAELFSVFHDQPREESLHQMDLLTSLPPPGYWTERGL